MPHSSVLPAPSPFLVLPFIPPFRLPPIPPSPHLPFPHSPVPPFPPSPILPFPSSPFPHSAFPPSPLALFCLCVHVHACVHVLPVGTFKAKGGEVKEAVKAALAAGYRHIDTASVYKNEAEVGEAIREYGIAREEVFITSKASPYEHGFQQALAACAASLERLQTDYLDLYLLHWPGVAKLDRASEKNAEIRLESWRALEQLQREGKCLAIGVSNFTAAHLDHLMTNSATLPAVNQVEVHPLLTQRSLRVYCAERGICVAAYSPLGCGQLLQQPTVQQVAKEVEQSAAQVLLRWSLQHGM
ncbi:unnamed protein product, partial [Closterium sp. NIES-65]